MAYDKKKYSNIDLSKYDKGYQASSDVIAAQKAKEQAENAVNNYGEFTYGKQDVYDKAMDAILNRKPFTYDLNGDALYQQYKDQYTALGKLAMQDTMGQAAALTGGYGNSYAATAGNQAYQGYLQQLNNIVPELYSLALSAYNSEGDRLNNNFNLLTTDRNTQYGEWSDGYNRLVSERGYAADNYNNAYTQDYSKWNDNRNYDTTQYWNETNMGYQQERDAIADAQWQKEYNLAVSNANRAAATPSYQITNKDDVSDEMRETIVNEAFKGCDIYAYSRARGAENLTEEEWAAKYPDKAKLARKAYAQEYSETIQENLGAYLNMLVENEYMDLKTAKLLADDILREYGISV